MTCISGQWCLETLTGHPQTLSASLDWTGLSRDMLCVSGPVYTVVARVSVVAFFDTVTETGNATGKPA